MEKGMEIKEKTTAGISEVVLFGFVTCKAQTPSPQYNIRIYTHDFNGDGINDQIILYENTKGKG